MSSVSLAKGRTIAADQDLLYWPPQGTPLSSVGVILAHGGGAPATAMSFQDPINSPQQFQLPHTLSRAGYRVSAPDLAGLSFGNDTAVGAVDATVTFLLSLGCTAVVGVGISMGHNTLANYARAHPTKLLRLAGIAPLCDLDAIRNGNIGGYRASIDAAWGVTYPAALPARANPTNNVATIVSGGLTERLYYSTADTTITPGTVSAYTTHAPAQITKHVISTTLDHGDALFGQVPLNDLLGFLGSGFNPA